MSVINNVLRDLDHKPTSFTPLTADSIPETAAKQPGWIGYWLAVPAVIIVFAVVTYLEPWQSNDSGESMDSVTGLEVEESATTVDTVP